MVAAAASHARRVLYNGPLACTKRFRGCLWLFQRSNEAGEHPELLARVEDALTQLNAPF